jgi:hypothetical protein
LSPAAAACGNWRPASCISVTVDEKQNRLAELFDKYNLLT